jgi:SAM-dependent methyltransferase
VDTWEAPGATFVDQYDSLYGQVRTHVLHQHLCAHLPPPPATIIDIGGGAGNQALPLAEAGYDVTIVDSSPAMLDRAQARIAALPASVAARVHVVHATGEQARASVGDTAFDGVLCHGVLPYVDDEPRLVAALCDLAAPAGIVSIMTKNARVLAMRPAINHDWAAALAAFDETREVNSLGLATRGDTVEELGARLDRHGVTPLAWYGVRLFTEGWGRREPRAAPTDAVLAVELEASRRDPYRQVSRCFHLVGVRR